jgi:thiol-disulfide isomerase/thioredoxin
MIRKNLSNILFVVVLVILYFTGGLSQLSSMAQSAMLHSGFADADIDDKKDEAFNYNFAIKDLKGNTFSFDQYKGKVVFLNMWATWCGPCKAEMPSIQQLRDQISNEKIAFVMLSLDKEKHVEKVKSYIKDKEFTFPVFMASGYLTDQLQVPSIPTTFIISKEGKIVMKEIGMKNYNTAKIKKFLDGLANE